MRLITTGFLQVFFVALNTVFLSRGYIVGIVIAGFLISFLWAFNVKRVAFGSMGDRVLYATGAAAGSIGGYYVASVMLSRLMV
jgi:hypothetical protein